MLTPPNVKDLQLNIEASPLTGDKTTQDDTGGIPEEEKLKEVNVNGGAIAVQNHPSFSQDPDSVISPNVSVLNKHGDMSGQKNHNNDHSLHIVADISDIVADPGGGGG